MYDASQKFARRDNVTTITDSEHVFRVVRRDQAGQMSSNNNGRWARIHEPHDVNIIRNG